MDHSKIILTRRCNLDCCYCTEHNKAGAMADRAQVLDACRRAAGEGIHRFQMTGGEPLLYDDVPGLVRDMKAVPGVDWVSLTTNGTLLYPLIAPLKEAGLDGINVHLDTCEAYAFTEITGRSQMLNEILRGIWAAVARDIPLTVSAVMLQENAAHLPVLAGLARQYDLTVRFVSGQGTGSAAGPDEHEALGILSRSVKGLERRGKAYHVPGWKGRIEFGTEICGAFDMEQGAVLVFGEDALEGQS